MASLFESGVRPLIDEWLLEESRKKRNYGEYWSASSAGYCHRKLIFERLGVPHIESEDDARKQRIFTSGKIFHDWIQDITKEAGLSIAQEVELQDEELMVRGHFDDLVLVNGKLILLDYKTRNSRSFEPYAKRPSHYHKMQLGTYMYMLRKAAGTTLFSEYATDIADLTEARTLNISKDDLRMAEVQYMWSEALEKQIVNCWKQLNAAWRVYNEHGMLPECTCDKYEGGFLAKEKWNPYWFNGSPCSTEYFEEWKAAQEIKAMDKQLGIDEKAEFLGDMYQAGHKAYEGGKDAVA